MQADNLRFDQEAMGAPVRGARPDHQDLRHGLDLHEALELLHAAALAARDIGCINYLPVMYYKKHNLMVSTRTL